MWVHFDHLWHDICCFSYFHIPQYGMARMTEVPYNRQYLLPAAFSLHRALYAVSPKHTWSKGTDRPAVPSMSSYHPPTQFAAGCMTVQHTLWLDMILKRPLWDCRGEETKSFIPLETEIHIMLTLSNKWQGLIKEDASAEFVSLHFIDSKTYVTVAFLLLHHNTLWSQGP